MRLRAKLSALVLPALALGLVALHAQADDAAEKARRALVAARIGSHSVTVGDLEDRLAKVPRYQLTTFGPDAPSIRKKFLNDVVADDILLSIGAEQQKIDQRLVVQQALARARAEATRRAVRQQAEAQPITQDDVQKYYNDHIAEYDQPERVGIWRILCKTREEAVSVLEAAKKNPTPDNFVGLARDHSIDKATNLRGGNEGFVAPDGTSNEAGLRVDLAVVKAAAAVKDGEFVADPVQEGSSGFAVVWHRGTAGASKRSVKEVDGLIRDLIQKKRGDDAVNALRADLRARLVKEENDSLLKTIEISQTDGTIAPRRRAGQVPALKSSF